MEAPSPPPVMIPLDFKADKIVGVIIMVVAGFSALAGMFVIWIGATIGQAVHQANIDAAKAPAKSAGDVVQNGQGQPGPEFFGSLFSTIGWVVVGIAFLQFASGIGVFKGGQKGLIFALAIAALSLLGGVYGIIMGVAIGMYVILRLWGNVGPRPA